MRIKTQYVRIYDKEDFTHLPYLQDLSDKLRSMPSIVDLEDGSLEIMMNNAGFKVEYISSVNRIDSLYAAISHSVKNIASLKLIFRFIIFPNLNLSCDDTI